MVRRITGKGQWEGIKQLETNGNKITNIVESGNTLGKNTISKHSASSNYTKIFQEQ